MTETAVKWLTETNGRELFHYRWNAPLRKMQLIAAALARQLRAWPENAAAKWCDDILEAVADHPELWGELEATLDARPGDWRYARLLPTRTLGPRIMDRAKSELQDMVAFNGRDAYPLVFDLIRDVLGNPFRPATFDPAWRTSTVAALARGMYDTRDFTAMPILADALQDAGCDNDEVLDHCRDAHATHVRGCWVVDAVLGKG